MTKHAGHLRSVERVRAAIEAAGAERVARLAAHSRTLLEARAQGEALRTIAGRDGVSYQAIYFRERKALSTLARA